MFSAEHIFFSTSNREGDFGLPARLPGNRKISSSQHFSGMLRKTSVGCLGRDDRKKKRLFAISAWTLFEEHKDLNLNKLYNIDGWRGAVH